MHQFDEILVFLSVCLSTLKHQDQSYVHGISRTYVLLEIDLQGDWLDYLLLLLYIILDK